MAALNVRLLGGFDARLRPDATLRFPARKTEALLAYLALPPGRMHPRDKLTALLWDDRSDRQARQSLRQALSHLRRAFRPAESAAAALVEHGETVGLDPAAADVDAVSFERRARSKTIADLTIAADLYQGDLLAGLFVKAQGFEEWLMAERARLHEIALEGQARLVSLLGEVGEIERAIQEAGRLLALDPLQEPAHRALMRLYVRAGRRDAALRQCQVCVEVLRRELGVEPDRATRQIYQDLVGQRGVSARPRRPALPAPAPGPPLIGRDDELERLRAALETGWRGEPRVATVLGEAAAWVLATRGDAKAAIEAAERAMERAPDPSTRAIAEGLLGYACLEAGDVARAIAILEPLVPKASRFEIRRSTNSLFLAEAFRRMGRTERAREVATAGIDAGRAVGFPWSIGWGERLLGRIALASGDLATAGERLGDALTTFTSVPARFEIAVTHLDLAELSRARGDAAAAEHLRTAWTAFETLGIREFARRAETLAARLGLPLARAS